MVKSGIRTSGGRRKGSSRRRLIILLVLSALLYIVTRNQPAALQSIHQVFTDVSYSVKYLVSRPVVFTQDFLALAQNYLSLRSENNRLKKELDKFHQIEIENEMLRHQIDDYRELFNVQPEAQKKSIVAEIMFDPGGPFVRTYVLNVGYNNGVTVGDTVVGQFGLVGRIVSVGVLSSRVLLVTDLNSRIPVRVEPAGVNAILAGDNSDVPKILFNAETQNMSDGDIVMASGLGGQVQSGTPIGKIRLERNGSISVILFEKLDHLNLVRVLHGQQNIALKSTQDEPVILKTAPQANSLTDRQGE